MKRAFPAGGREQSSTIIHSLSVGAAAVCVCACVVWCAPWALGGVALPFQEFLSSMDPDLPPNWEAVTGEDGRTYYWNVDTDETSWEVPIETKAISSVASGYVEKVSSSSSGGASGVRDIDALAANELGGVAKLSQRFNSTTLDDEQPSERGETITSAQHCFPSG